MEDQALQALLKNSHRSSEDRKQIERLYKEMYSDLFDFTKASAEEDDEGLYGTQSLTPTVGMCEYRTKIAKVITNIYSLSVLLGLGTPFVLHMFLNDLDFLLEIHFYSQ